MAMTEFSGVPVIGADGQPLDRIELRGLRATANHGVLVRERENPQEFIADVALYLDAQPAAQHDAIGASVNYAVVADAVGRTMTGPAVNLIETLAEQIAAAVLEFPAVQACDVVLHKPGAALPVPTDDVVISVRRDSVHKKPVALVRPNLNRPAFDSAEFGETAIADAELPQAIEPILAPPVVAAAVVTPAAEPELLDSAAILAADKFSQVPEAPVPAILGLGSNLGDSIETLRKAIIALQQAEGIEVDQVGPLARTSPVGGPAGQGDYFNTVAAIGTTLSARGLLDALQQIETDFHRVRAEEWGPRTLDLDIVTYGDLIAATDDLTIPHKLAHDRAFVLLPWSQMQPDAVLPGPGGGPVGPLAATAPDRAGVRWLRLDWLEPVAEATPDEAQAEPGSSAAFVPFTSQPHDAAQHDEAQYESPQYENPLDDGPLDADEPLYPSEAIPQAALSHAAPHPAPMPLQPEPAFEPPTQVEYQPVAQRDAHLDPPTLVGQPGLYPEAPPLPHPESAALHHAWAPSVPAASGPEYPSFTGILQGVPGQHYGQVVGPGHPQAQPQHANNVPSHSLPTFTGGLRAESPLAARAERVPLLRPNDLEPPELSHPVPHTPADQIPPFSRPVSPQPAPNPAPPKVEVEAPSWDQILRG